MSNKKQPNITGELPIRTGLTKVGQAGAKIGLSYYEIL